MLQRPCAARAEARARRPPDEANHANRTNSNEARRQETRLAGLILGLAMVVMGCYGITIGAPLETSDADVVRWGSLVLAVLGVWLLWTGVNDAYEASRE